MRAKDRNPMNEWSYLYSLRSRNLVCARDESIYLATSRAARDRSTNIFIQVPSPLRSSTLEGLFESCWTISAEYKVSYWSYTNSQRWSVAWFILSKRWKYRSYLCCNFYASDIHRVAILIFIFQFRWFVVSPIADSVIIFIWRHGVANTYSVVKSIGHQSILSNRE